MLAMPPRRGSIAAAVLLGALAAGCGGSSEVAHRGRW
jgi:hypothetical protein